MSVAKLYHSSCYFVVNLLSLKSTSYGQPWSIWTPKGQLKVSVHIIKQALRINVMNILLYRDKD